MRMRCAPAAALIGFSGCVRERWHSSLYNATERALPIPLVPPVIITVLPFRPNKEDKYCSISSGQVSIRS